jgi:hypothetical protein
VARCSNVILAEGESRKGITMINKFFTVLTAVLIFGSASVASAGTGYKPVRQYDHAQRGRLMMLENVRARGPAADANAAAHFQSNWNVSY